MRKFTLLLSAFMLSAAGASATVGDVITDAAGLSNAKVYYLKSARESGTKYLLYDGASHAGYLASTYSNQGSSLALEGNETKFQFAIYKYNDKYYFYNVDADMFVGNSSANNGAIPMVSMPTNDVEIRFEGTVEGFKALFSTNGSGALNAANI